jgi:PTS system ascorbate-specific IIC component
MSFTTALIFAVLYIVVATIAGPEIVAGFTGGLDMYLWALMQALKMAAGLLTLIYGVKMLLAEIVPAFVGISKKLIPGARPALDVPVLFPYSPTGTLVGFVGMFITWAVVGMPLAAALTGVIPVPSMTGIFFGGGTAGVVANGMGGRRACILSGVINGLLWPFLVAAFYSFLPMAALAPGIAWLCYDNMSLALMIVGLGMLLGLY